HAASARQQRVLLLHVRIGVKRNRSHIVVAFERPPIQCLDVAQSVFESQPGHTNFFAGQAVEHEGVVGIRTVRDGNSAHRFRRDGDGGVHASQDCWLRGIILAALAMPAAAPTFAISARRNGYRPQLAAMRNGAWNANISQPIPAANKIISAMTEALSARAKPPLPCNAPARNATSG